MKPSEAIRLYREEIRQIVAQHHADNARIFGSVAHGNDTETSDLDLLVDPSSETTLLDLAKIRNRLQSLLGVSVDVLTPKGLPQKFRSQVIAEAIPL